MAGEVLFTPFESAGEPDALNLRIAAMLEFSGLFTALPEGASVAVKIHPGEKNNTTYIRPALPSASNSKTTSEKSSTRPNAGKLRFASVIKRLRTRVVAASGYLLARELSKSFSCWCPCACRLLTPPVKPDIPSETPH